MLNRYEDFVCSDHFETHLIYFKNHAKIIKVESDVFVFLANTVSDSA